MSILPTGTRDNFAIHIPGVAIIVENSTYGTITIPTPGNSHDRVARVFQMLNGEPIENKVRQVFTEQNFNELFYA